jgi:hypothetical protein
MNYYMTQRPPSLGTHPKAGLVCAVEYDEKLFIPKIGMKAWACLTYNRELTDKEVCDYELVPETRKLELTTAEIMTIMDILEITAHEFPDSIEIISEVHQKLDEARGF